jgi:hypothetical protein
MFSWLKPTSILWRGANVAPKQYQPMRLPQFLGAIIYNRRFLPHCDERKELLFPRLFKGRITK